MLNNYYELHHRTRDKVKNFGEVYTPPEYVMKMLSLLDTPEGNSIWGDERVVIFEPTCGHGNFVEAILEKRLNGFLKKYADHGERAPYFAVAMSINSLWATDLDKDNVTITRMRIFSKVLSFLCNRLEEINITKVILKNMDFLAHVACTVKWQIHVNEMISALIDETKAAKEQVKQTRTSKTWLKMNKHKPIDFDLTWCEYFKAVQDNGSTPIEYKMATKELKKAGVLTSKNDWSFVHLGFNELDSNDSMLKKVA